MSVDKHQCGIYVITSTSGGVYVGSAVNFNRRWFQHERDLMYGIHPNAILQNAWIKYGPEGFEFKSILLCSPNNLLLYEQLVIDLLQPRYNLAPTAGNQLGVRWSAESRMRKSQQMKLVLAQNPEWKENFAVGRRWTSEQQKQFALDRIGRKHSAESRLKMSLALIGKASSLKGVKRSDAVKEKISAAKKGKAPRMTSCPHCGLKGSITLIKRWHYDNCRNQPNAE